MTKSRRSEGKPLYDYMKVRFTLEALTHIAGVRFYIEQRSAQAAIYITERIFAEADRLGEFPQFGHIGVVPATYEWTVPRLPYVIVHEIDEDSNEVIIVGVFHGSQAR
jgi:toxin ParE1/3/4